MGEDLNIYMIDSKNLQNSINLLERKLRKRTRKDKEFWFIDISALKTINNAKLMLNNLLLDIDDDIYAFMITNDSIAVIWEMYKLAPEKNLIVTKLGVWKEDLGLSLTTLNKWQRRGDLTVSFAKNKYRNYWIKSRPLIQVNLY